MFNAIEKKHEEAKLQMHLRIAKFRGFLFDQGIDLKYGHGYKDLFLKQVIEAVSQPGVIGGSDELYYPSADSPNKRFVLSLLGKQKLLDHE